MLSTVVGIGSKELFAWLRGTTLLFRRPIKLNFDDIPVEKEPNLSPKDLDIFTEVWDLPSLGDRIEHV